MLLLGGTWSPGGRPGLLAQDAAWSSGTLGTGLLLRRLDGVKRVLLIGAHPDDEDTALLAALSRGMGAEAAYLSLTRGEGGQNLVGQELDEGLGVLRTGELLAARALDGGRQFFTRAFDFGFSRTAEETFRYWPRDEVLADVTWVVRTFRPQVVISVFAGTPGDGHGHHQAAGILAMEAFRAAGDPARFPEQLARGARAWAPAKLYRLTRRDPQQGATWVETGVLDPLLGRSWYQVAMDSRSQHRSQDMGTAQPIGPRRSTLALVEARSAAAVQDELFAGVDTTLVGAGSGLEGEVGIRVRGKLEGYRAALAEAREALSLVKPWAAAPALGRAVTALAEVEGLMAEGAAAPAGDGVGDEDLAALLLHRLPLVREAFLRSAGVVVDVRVEREFLVAGETAEGVVELWNGGPFPLRGASARLSGPEGWRVGGGEGGPGPGGEVPAGGLVRWRFRIEVPASAQPSRPYYLREPRKGEMYRWPGDASLWGGASDPAILAGEVEVEVGELGRARARREAGFRGVDKATGEFTEPLLVVPALSLELDPPSMVSAAGSGEPRVFSVRIQSWTEAGREGTLALQLPQGWDLEPAQAPFRLVGAGAEASIEFKVAPPRAAAAGSYVVSALARTVQGETFREGTALVDYPHVKRTALPAPAAATVEVLPVALRPGLRVGYVMGSGDMGAEVLRQLGAAVELLGPEAVRAGAYHGFDAVVLGIRAYETRPELGSANAKLLEYARGGGTVLVQYNKYEYPQGGFAPFPVEMSRPHDRVTDEEAPVVLLDPTHPALRHPNLIGASDFEGWTQERGLYFLSRWDSAYTPLLEMADPGQDPLRGGLLVAKLGEGAYVYTGLAFFRQFPAAVPGAYRLFANLVSLKGEDLRGR
jgi:LmbE family N-acetylglucosaminyl deacetylase